MLARATRFALGLRYRIRVRGLVRVAEKGTSGILFLCNHPALIDPVILLSHLDDVFRVRPVGDRDQAKKPFIRWVSRKVQAITIADPVKEGTAARASVEAGVAAAVAALHNGENLLVYPSGHIYTSRFEDLRGNSGVHSLLTHAPDVRVVLLSLHGLWGSRFSRAQTGAVPELSGVLRRSVLDLVANGLFFIPRRRLTLTAEEPEDLPRAADRETLNSYLEKHFNRHARPNTFVPYTLLKASAGETVPDPVIDIAADAAIVIPVEVRAAVVGRLREITGVEIIEDDANLARDLGCDSIVRAELLDWVGEETGAADADVDALRTVHDVMVVAAGIPLRSQSRSLSPVPVRWFAGDRRAYDPAVPEGDTVVEVFVRRALAEPRTVILADQTSGVRSYRDILTAIFVLKPHIAALPGTRVGLMMPASVGADVLYLAILCAGKVPVMVNWTVGPRQVSHGLQLADTEVVLTARALVERLAAQGVSFASYQERFCFLEDVVAKVTTMAKVSAVVRAHLAPRSLLRAAIQDTAVILFTSGSESLPKAVPLSHRNLLANLRDIAERVRFVRGDRLLSVLPPFHSFGLTAGVLMPLLNGVPTAHSPNPRDAAMLAAMVGAYSATLIGGTPTFLAAMVGCAGGGQLDSLRLAVTGGEACPQQVYDALAARCRGAMILEGYGVTECSPIVSINSPEAHKPGTIGRVMPSLRHVVINMDSGGRCATGEHGILLVRGPSVFDGYLNHSGDSPFVDLEGHRWFKTNDVVSEDEQGFLIFRGRKGRFVKRAGEMISLPAIEAVLGAEINVSGSEGPAIAVVALGDDSSPQLLLCTTLPLERQAVNRRIRAAGLSPLHTIHQVVQVAELPVLGTGKTDYRSLGQRLVADQ